MANTRKIASILTSDLVNSMAFDTRQTLPVMDVESDEYDEGMSLYLQSLGVQQLDANYNEMVRKFETQLEEQELSAKFAANVVSDVTSNMAVEAQPGMGTGAAAVAAEGRQSFLAKSHESIEQSVEDTYASGMQEIGEQYRSDLESILGKYDAATGTFANLTEYQSMADKSTEALMKVLAKTLKSDLDTTTDDYIGILRNIGYIEQDANGIITLTSSGQEQIDRLVNAVDVNEANELLEGETLMSAVAKEMAIADYTTASGVSSWDSVSETKKTEILKKYESWLYNNQNNLRLTSWELYEINEKGGILLDTQWQMPELTASGLYREGVDTESGIYITKLTIDDIESDTESQARLDEIKRDVASGKIPDGAYITFSTGKADEDDKFYYVYNGTIYKTEYSQENPPPKINVSSATVYSFGLYKDVGRGNKRNQDVWVQSVIDAAKAGKIADGTYIDMNYGFSSEATRGNERTSWYKYENGYFIRVEESKVPKATASSTPDNIQPAYGVDPRRGSPAGRPTPDNYGNTKMYSDNVLYYHSDEQNLGGIDW